MNFDLRKLPIAAAGLTLLLASSATATPTSLLTANNIEWGYEKGFKKDGTSAITDDQRASADSIFNQDNLWFSLGFSAKQPNSARSEFGGRVYASASEGYYFSGTLDIREVTFGVDKANYPERAQVRLFGSKIANPLIIELTQTPKACAPDVCTMPYFNGDTTQWLISGLDQYRFTQLEIIDHTLPLGGPSEDGFDLGYVSAQVSPVPEPASIGMMGGACLLFGFVAQRMRRSKQ